MLDARFKSRAPFSNKDIDLIEKRLKRKLPDTYIQFIKQYGPAFVGGAVDGDEGPDIDGFSGHGENGVHEMLDMYDDLWDNSLFPFASDGLGNRWILDENNKVFYIDYYGGTTKVEKVAESFQEFLDRIVVTDE